MKRLEKVEKLLFQCEKDVKRFDEIILELEKIEKNRKKLEEYYESEYMKDFDNAEKYDRDYAMLDEDSIWNILTDEYQNKIKLLKILANSI